MDIPIFVELIGTIGFPIAVAIAMAWFISKIYKDQKAEKETLIEALNKANETNTKCVETLATIDARLTVIENRLLNDKVA